MGVKYAVIARRKHCHQERYQSVFDQGLVALNVHVEVEERDFLTPPWKITV